MKNLFDLIWSDLRFYASRRSLWAYLGAFLFNRKFQLILLYRVGSSFEKNRFTRRFNIVLAWLMSTFYSCEINFFAKIGRNIKFPHPFGIVIGRDVIIHDNITIFQHVSIGTLAKPGEKMTYPEIYDGAVVYANSSIFGKVVVGKNAVIGAHSMVINDVPDGAVVAGVPAKAIHASS